MKQLLLFILVSFSMGISAQTVILSTDFQNGMPSNYTIVDNDGNVPDPTVAEYTSAWITVVDPENALDTVAASTSYFTSLDSASRWMITPALSLGAFGNFIKWNAKSHDPSFPDSYLVLASSTDNQIASFTDTIGFIEEENFEWTNREINLFTQGYHDQTIYVAFVNITLDGFKLYVDDIEARKEDPVGLQEPTVVPYVVYPNPTTDFIEVASPQKIDKLEVLDLNGTLVLSSSTPIINVQSLPTGMYLVRFLSNGISTTQRISKI
ncbi:MAG: hypothetical protein RLZZ30_1406 [Bacteroidota bacterium]|jgi:hypothetical protein